MQFRVAVLVASILFTSLVGNAQVTLPSDLILSMKGIGPVHLGMTVQDASVAGGSPIMKGDHTVGVKYKTYLTKDALFWVGATDGRVHMVCTLSNRFSTAEGIRNGDSVKKLSQFSPRKLKHMSNPMHYQLQPTDPKDRGYVIWFEVHGEKIESICAGTQTLHSYVMDGGT